MEKKTSRRKIVVGGMVSALVILIFVFALVFHHLSADSLTVTNEKIQISENGYHPANAKQFAATVKMYVWDEKLHIIRDRKLSVFDNGTLEEIAKMDYAIIAMSDGFIYYDVYNEQAEEKPEQIYSYDLRTGKRTLLAETELTWLRDSYLAEDGTLYVPTDDNRTSYIPITANQVGDQLVQNAFIEVGGKRYMLEGVNGYGQLVYYDQNGEKNNLPLELPYGQKSMIPCDGGLLVHNEGYGNLLYYIEGDTGEVTELFAFECLDSVSAVNVQGDYVFLSFKRYEKYGQFAPLRYKNDTLEGTYRISLTDYSVEKISDEIYNGLYIFDDTGIYACDENCNIYKLDFDGNRILTILK